MSTLPAAVSSSTPCPPPTTSSWPTAWGCRPCCAAGARRIGIAVSHSPVWTAGDSDDDRAAAALYDTLTNRLFADPLLTGDYPDGLAELLPGPVAEDLKTISAPLDWYGINYYNPMLVGARSRPPTPPPPTPPPKPPPPKPASSTLEPAPLSEASTSRRTSLRHPADRRT